MAHMRSFAIIAVVSLAGCTRHQPGPSQPPISAKRQLEEPEGGKKVVRAGPDQTLVFRQVSPAKYRIDYPDFYVLETEVTNAQFKAFLDATGAKKDDADVLRIVRERDASNTFSTGDTPNSIEDESTIWRNGQYPAGLDDHPVALVTLPDATQFADWLNKTAGERGIFRLPTWNEWMIAAYGDSRNYPWGNKWDRNNLHTSFGLRWSSRGDDTVDESKKQPRRTEPAMARPGGRTPEGLFGMLGNVSEYIVEGDPTSDSYFLLGSRWMGGGFTDGIAFRGDDPDRMPPRNDYWGYSHSPNPRECDLGFRVIFVPTPEKNEEMLKHPQLFQQNNRAWNIKDDESKERSDAE